MKLSLIIVSYNVQHFLELCLQSVQEALKNIDSEVIVVDNASADDSCKVVADKFPSVNLIANNDNLGFSKATNQGVAIAKGEYVLILNPDTVVGENTLKNALNFAEKQSDFGALGVQLIDGKGDFLPESKREIPTPKISFYKMLGWTKNNSKNYYANYLSADENGKVAVLVGAFMLMKRSVYNEVGGFDERYFMYGEDIDLSYKILKNGYQNYYYGNEKVIHFKGESTIKDKNRLYDFYKAMEIFYNTHFKVNKVYDFMMKFGIRIWKTLSFFGLKKKKNNIESKEENIVYFGSDMFVFNQLKSLKHIKKVLQYNGETLAPAVIVFDNNNLPYYEIIDKMTLLKNKILTFKIHPKNTNFILGSNSSETQGEVIILD